MEENQTDLEKRNKTYESLKKFFTSDMKIKQKLLELAPTELDDVSEESRIEYSDKLYKAIKDFEVEFIDMFQNILEDNSSIIEIVRTHFTKAKEAFLIGHYEQGVIQKLYQEQFSNMSPKLVEEVKGKFVGYTYRGNLAGMVEKSGSVNELLHVMHSYVLNNEDLLQALPIIETRQNIGKYPITLYGEETELSRKLFEGIPEELDVGDTNIVSMPNKILMMVRDRGHALTIDMDTTKENDIGVKYFIPKICNKAMVEALPGVNTSSIRGNGGATGFFVTSKEDMTRRVVDFIGRVPMDTDMEPINWEEIIKMVREGQYYTAQKPQTETEQIMAEQIVEEPEAEEAEEPEEKETPIFGEEDAQELAMEKSEKGRQIGNIRYLQNTLANTKEKLNTIFKGEKNDDRTNGD